MAKEKGRDDRDLDSIKTSRLPFYMIKPLREKDESTLTPTESRQYKNSQTSVDEIQKSFRGQNDESIMVRT